MSLDAVVPVEPRRAASESPNPPASALLHVLGGVPRPAAFSREALGRMARHDLGPTQVLCYSGRAVAQVDSYAGARLVDVLDACGFSERPRSELKRCVVVALGDDGYQAIFSWNELYNSTIGEKALVLYEKNGGPLEPHLGRAVPDLGQRRAPRTAPPARAVADRREDALSPRPGARSPGASTIGPRFRTGAPP